jgi:hypothetical protein
MKCFLRSIKKEDKKRERERERAIEKETERERDTPTHRESLELNSWVNTCSQ